MASSDLHRKLLAKGMPPLPNRIEQHSGVPKTGGRASTRNYSPSHWQEYFDEKLSIKTSQTDVFNVYTKGDASSSLVLLLLHGGGYSGLTWACFAKYMVTLIGCRVVAIDLRGHGDTITSNDYNLSAEAQSIDVENVLQQIYPDNLPPIFLMGHSMGGAIAVHVAHRGIISSLVGLAVIDVVEGSALDALQSMQNVLRSRPERFKSLDSAVEWCVRSGQTRNFESARISMPGQVKKIITSDPSTSIEGQFDEEEETNDEKQVETFKKPSTVGSSNEFYTWRIDLSKTEKYWNGWFSGLSKMFLDVAVAKLLLLAGVDRLDKDLTVGQMQGKFQMIVLPKVGHAVHEDSPERVAEVVASFLVRNRFATSKTDFKPVFPGC